MTLRQVAAASEVPLRLVVPVVRDMTRDLNVDSPPITPADLLPKLFQALPFPEGLADRIESYLRLLTERGYQISGFAPATILGAVAYAAAQDWGHGFSQERIAQALGISTVTIRSRMPDLRAFLQDHADEIASWNLDKGGSVLRVDSIEDRGAPNAEESPASGHTLEAVAHINHMLDQRDLGDSLTEQSRLLFNGLNKLQTDRLAGRTGPPLGEVAGFEWLVQEAFGTRAANELASHRDFATLVELRPQIMNHNTLRHHDYNPNQPITASLRTLASDEHRQLEAAWGDLSASRVDLAAGRFLKKLGQLLYVVRSNIAHGEKTPYGPDLKKRARDEAVSRVVIPIQVALIDALLGYPSTKLVVYGTLGPGRSSSHLTDRLKGSWEVCLVSGEVRFTDGLASFHWSLDGDEVPAQLFTSADLQSAWQSLDSFEQGEYKRRLIPYRTTEERGVSYIYLASAES